MWPSNTKEDNHKPIANLSYFDGETTKSYHGYND